MDKILQVYETLLEKYGFQGWWPVLDASSNSSVYDKSFPERERTSDERFEICIGAVLTQNTSWQNVEKALYNLKIKKLLSLNKLETVNVKSLASLIKPSGYYNQKAKKIKEVIKFLKSGKEINRENLLSVWGVGPETADSILLYAYNKPIFVIDAYTKRVMNRLGFKENSYEDLQRLFMQNLPKDVQVYNEYHALLVRLGKEFCKKKPSCKECPILKNCKMGKP
ncbi:MAG: endonuclease [Nanoarchaeota archaeon]|nr:endonuclease [Nanoarchaeota archaeon]